MAISTTNDSPPIAGIVVAGGSSRRLGTDKRKLRLWGDEGPTLLEHTVGILADLCTEIIVVLNDPEQWQDLPAQLLCDCYADAGALGGIYSGLAAISTAHALVVAADLPFLNRELLQAMIALPRDYDVLVPPASQPNKTRNRDGLETLHAIYSKTCLPPMQHLLEQDERRITAVFSHVTTITLMSDYVKSFDPLGRAFLNINTPEELIIAQKHIQNSSKEPDDSP
ncbi:MAG: molybdenum cofactor guanylyltransferase [Chloroflexota bacterium]